MQLISVSKIWDAAEHNAFTDLVRFNGDLYTIFREGEAHVCANGALRLLRSVDEGTLGNRFISLVSMSAIFVMVSYLSFKDSFSHLAPAQFASLNHNL